MDKEIVFGIICSTIAIMLLVGGIILALFIGNRKRLQQKMLFTQKELNYEKELRQAENEVGESLMARFSQELHDNIGHSLTCIRIHVENKKLDNPALEDIFSPIEVYLNDASKQLRALSRSLNTDYITNIGFTKAIAAEVDRLKQLNRQAIVYDYDNSQIVLDKNQELMIYRIFQEIIHNVMRHSKAGNLSIILSGKEGFFLSVKDDGAGFNLPEILSSPNASGLRNILNRAQLAGMNCEISSIPGGGCAYTITPVNK